MRKKGRHVRDTKEAKLHVSILAIQFAQDIGISDIVLDKVVIALTKTVDYS